MNNSIPITESLYKKSKPIDQLSNENAIQLFLKEQIESVISINSNIKTISEIIESCTKHLIRNSKGRIVYCGAGSSGRIGVQDGAELYPTFGWPKKRSAYLIAGRNLALTESVENAEDNEEDALMQVSNLKINEKDIVFGIAASGNTPFTCKALEEAKKRKSLTIAITNNPEGKILQHGTYKLILETGSEIVAGSTRLKAGTSQKIILNLFSTLIMVNLGKVKNGQMINLVATNKKLKKRQIEIKKSLNE